MAGKWNYKNGLVVVPVSLWGFLFFGAFNLLSVFFVFFPLLSGAGVSDDHRPVAHFANQFFLQKEGASYCPGLDVEGDESTTCVHQNPEQKRLCYPGNRAVIKPCDDNSPFQKWYYDFQRKTIHYQGFAASMCLSRMIDTLAMLPCIESTSAQIWLFDEQGRLSNATDRQQENGYIALLDKSEDPAPLLYRYLEADMGERRRYKNLHTGQTVCEFEREPVNDQGREPGEEKEASEQEIKPEKPLPPEETVPPEEAQPEEEKVPPVLSWEERPERAFWVSERLTEDILLVNQNLRLCLGVSAAERCLSESPDMSSCYSSTSIELGTCDSQNSQVWRHDLLTKRIFNRAAGYRYCLTWLPGSFSLLPCFPGGSPSQKWYFARGKTPASPERGRLRTMLNGGLDPYSYTEALTLPITVNEQKKKKPKELKVYFEWLLGRCGRHPVTGVWLDDCPVTP
ncbi:RICIN domain-containing protein [Endozoicomonas sp. 2B-B]